MFEYRTACHFLMVLALVYDTQQQKDPAFMQTYTNYVAECAKENGLQVDFVNNIWDQKHFPNDNNLKCYFKCLNVKLGIMNQNGDVIDDVLKTVSAQFNDAATEREIVAECGGIQGADLCETAFALMACVLSATLD